MPRVTSQKTRQMLLVTGDPLDANELPEKVQLYRCALQNLCLPHARRLRASEASDDGGRGITRRMACNVLTVKLPESVMKGLTAAAQSSGVSRHAFVREVLEEAANRSGRGAAAADSAESIVIRAQLRREVALQREFVQRASLRRQSERC